MTVQIRPSRADDLEYATALLKQAGLPVDDLVVEKLAFTAECDDAIYGLIGVESFGDTALLRSLVIAEPARGKGVGRGLLTALCARAKYQGLSNMVGVIGADREGSLALHAACGYVEVGRLPCVGDKFGEKLDMVIMQKTL